MSRVRRLTRITTTLMRYRLDSLITPDNMQIGGFAALLLRASPSRLLPQPKASTARRLRLALESLGPVFIKFGQILSTRRDLLPEEFADELANLQDRVPPFSGELARARIEEGLGQPIDNLFQCFDSIPLASASVAQVHPAVLSDGSEVVVKVIRPDIQEVIEQDLKLLRTVAELAERLSYDARRLHLTTIVDDYQNTILGELNLKIEGSNTSRLRSNFADSPLLYVPRVYWEYSSENILVMERIHGVPIGQTDQLRAAGTDMKLLAERGVETFFTQVFVHNFFHADMHPGNIFVDVKNPADPRYIAIDCAIMGSLTEDDQTYLARNLLAFLNQDYHAVATLHLESGWIPEGTDVTAFEAVIQEVCAPIFEKPLNEISFGHFLITLFQTARSFNMEVQPQLVLLQKTLLNIEGLGRQLYPELDLWLTAKPFMERWMTDRMSPLTGLRELADQGPDLLNELPRFPAMILSANRDLKMLKRSFSTQREQVNRLQQELQLKTRRQRRTRLIGLLLVLLAVLSGWADLSAFWARPVNEWLPPMLAVIGLLLLTRG